jgi:acetyl-CoA carboxylase/biotin carboxylase 1
MALVVSPDRHPAGDERAIEFVALATRDDLNANAEFIRLADTFVEVPSGSNKVRTDSVRITCDHRSLVDTFR